MQLELLRRIKAVVLDVDGVLTDGKVVVTEDGNLLRSMNIKDGYALKKAVDIGLTVIVISGGTSKGVQLRLNKLGVHHVLLGISDKYTALTGLMRELNLGSEEIAVMGDDIPDLAMMKLADMRVAPADAVAEVHDFANMVTSRNGGEGCVREFLDLLLAAKNS